MDNLSPKSTSLQELKHIAAGFAQMVYEYKRLNDGEFRVAHLKARNGPIYVELSVEPLDVDNPKVHTPEYDALSWQWGGIDHACGHTINIGDIDRNNYQQLVVRPNLLLALKTFRQNRRIYPHQRLWVDLICINQANSAEREKQLALMTKIYSKARQVCVWLGKPGHPVYPGMKDDFTDHELEVAVQSIDTLGNLDDVQHIGNVDIGIRNKADLYDLEPLFKLLKRGWFSRRWIVQVSYLPTMNGSLITTMSVF